MHTPTPWAARQDWATGRWYIEIREGGYKTPIVLPGICGDPKHIGGPRFQGDAGDNAKFIALACNCHDELLDALKNMVGMFDTPVVRRQFNSDYHREACESARAAIAKAEGRVQ